MKKTVTFLLILALLTATAALALAAGPAEHVHILDNGTVLTEPTCTQTGETEYTCLDPDCDYSVVIITPANGHAWELANIWTEQSCGYNGAYNYVCTVCGAQENRYPRHLGHKLVKGEVLYEPNCTETGVTRYYCEHDNCQREENIPFPPLGHYLDEGTIITEPTCEADGLAEKTCIRCGEKVLVRVPALAHNWDEGTVLTAATETTSGTIRLTCRDCGRTIVDNIPARSSQFSVRLKSGAGFSISPEDSIVVRADESVPFTVTLRDGWQKGENFAVRAENAVVEEQPDGSYILSQVRWNTAVKVTGITRARS